MAILKNSVLGNISGKLDNTVTRFRNGKYVIYKKPDHINYSRSKPAVDARTKFANAVRFAKFINSDEVLSGIWKNSKATGTNAYQKLIKYNSKYVTADGLTKNCIITPPGYKLMNNSYYFNSNNLVVNTQVEPIISIPIKIFVVFYFNNSKKNEFIICAGEDVVKDANNYLSAKITFDSHELKLIKKFGKGLFFAAFTFNELKNNQKYWSDTLSFEFEFPTKAKGKAVNL